jgi:hypothetical protein
LVRRQRKSLSLKTWAPAIRLRAPFNSEEDLKKAVHVERVLFGGHVIIVYAAIKAFSSRSYTGKLHPRLLPSKIEFLIHNLS